MDVGGVRLADPSTGELGPAFPLSVGNDAVFTSPAGDGFWCVCFTRTSESGGETASVEIRRVDKTGRVTQARKIGDYGSVAAPPYQDFAARFDLEVSRDQRTAYLSSATRAGDHWSVSVEAIDLSTDTVVGRTDLGNVAIPPAPSPAPSPDPGMIENYFSGPFTRLSPDGRRLIVHASVDSYAMTGGPVEMASPQAWLIDLGEDAGGGSIGRATAITGAFVARVRGCYWMAWTTNDELAAICWPTQEGRSVATLSLIKPDGTELRTFDLFDTSNAWLTDPVLDRANRRVFIWQPGNHILRRLDLDSGKVDELKVDPAATGGGPAGSGGVVPDTGSHPEWATFSSDFRIYYGPQLVAEPGGTRLFALGVLSSESNNYEPSSSGVWVFDANTLALVDRWTPVAAYGSIGLSKDGRWLFAAGAPSVDDEGKQTAWEASITVHDVSDGRPALQLGRLGVDVQILQVPP